MKISATSHSNPSFGVFHVLDTESSPASKTNDTLNKFVSSEYNNFGKEGAFLLLKELLRV